MTQVLIAGGGLAGGAAACRLAQAGIPVMLLERERVPAHKVCGEFLSGEALLDLAALGIDPAALGAVPITGTRLVNHRRVAESRLPFPAASLSRRVLDEALLQRAALLGAEIRRGVHVLRAEGTALDTDEGRRSAPCLFLATGKHDLRGLPRLLRKPPKPLIGFKMYLTLQPAQQAALSSHVEVILFAGGYAGLQMVEGGTANLTLLIDRARYQGLGQSWTALLAALSHEVPHLGRRLDGAAACWERPLSIFRVPYGFVHREDGQAGVFRLGDQAAVIPSFCGDGMAIALHSARLAAEAVRTAADAERYHRAMRRAAAGPVRLASGLSRVAASRPVRDAMIAGAQLWPGLMAQVARRTRIAAC